MLSSGSGAGVAIATSTGTVFFNGPEMRNNTAAVSGGAISVIDVPTLIIQGGTFTGNHATVGSGGAVRLNDATVVTINESTFGGSGVGDPNTAGTQGGGLESTAGGSITITDSSFISNTATVRGGGMWLENGSSVALNGVIVNQNHAATQGAGMGVMSVVGPVDIQASELQSSRFYNNQATGAGALGGGLYVSGSQTELNVLAETTFDSNSATTDGGGVYIDNARTAQFSEGTGFVFNTASGDGGGIYARTFAESLLTDGASFFFNLANNGSGGGVAVETVIADANATFRNSTFASNEATQNGAGVFVLTNNEVVQVDSSTFTENLLTGDDVTATSVFISVNNGTLDVVNSTFDETAEAQVVGTVAVNMNNATGNVMVRSSTVIGPVALAVGVNDGASDIMNSIFASTVPEAAVSVLIGDPLNARYNLLSTAFDASDIASASTNRFGIADMLLGDLDENGGPTDTKLPLAGSPALKAGNATIDAELPEFDQRGDPFVRVSPSGLDIGAVQTDLLPPLPATGSTVPL